MKVKKRRGEMRKDGEEEEERKERWSEGGRKG